MSATNPRLETCNRCDGAGCLVCGGKGAVLVEIPDRRQENAKHRERWLAEQNERLTGQLADLVKAADALHCSTFREFSHRADWQRLGGVLDAVSPREFDRVTGEMREGASGSEAPISPITEGREA